MRPVAMVRRVCDGSTGLDWASCTADYEYYDIVTERRGAPVMVVDATRNVIWSGKYSPYGLLYDEQGSLEFNLRLPGQYQDRETGWHYNGQRYYIPQMMRYNRPEPIGQAGSLDLFMYAGGDPVNRIDPTGLDDEPCEETNEDDSGVLDWLSKKAGQAIDYLSDKVEQVSSGEISIREAVGETIGDAIDAVNPVSALMTEAGYSEDAIDDATAPSRQKALEVGKSIAEMVPGDTVIDTYDTLQDVETEGWTGGNILMLGLAFGGLRSEAKAARKATTGGGASVENLSQTIQERIQHFSNKYGVDVSVVGSRARGTAHFDSDYDYIITGANSKLRKKARRELPRGNGGGELIGNRWSGQDFLKGPLDSDKPYITFHPME